MAVPDPAVAAPGDWRPRVFLVLLFLLFLLPIVGAMVLYLAAPSWLSLGHVNRGELVVPPLAIEPELKALTGRRSVDSAGVDQATWLVVHAGGPDCGRGCEQALVSMRQARLALGRDASRVERWWFTTGEVDTAVAARIAAAHPGLRTGTLSAGSVLIREGAPLLVVDPAGLVILRYSDAGAASDLLKDLKRLLKISQQG